MQRSNGNRGFTLIEMLVVIAIIGILSSVVLTALGPSRNKAKDARILTEVNQVRALAAVADNGGYKNFPSLDGCSTANSSAFKTTNPDLASLATDICAEGGELVIERSTDPLVKSLVIYSMLNTKANQSGALITQYYCVDSSGHSGYVLKDVVSKNMSDGSVVCDITL